MCSAETIQGLKGSFNGVVKPENVIDDASILESYAQDISFTSKRNPLLLVYPESKEEVQRIVSLANENKIPLVPVSSGRPRFNGDTVPGYGGVIIDFSKMKSIMKIDTVNRCAVVEAGVTFSELIPALKKQGMKLNIPLLPKASKSVVTSRLERVPNLIPKYQYDYIDPLLTLEVVYGTGDDFRTGSASGPGSLDTIRTDMVNPWGPGTVDFFKFLTGAQGTMGLVTWATTKTEVLPSIQKLYFIPVNDVAQVTAPMIKLLYRRVVDECLALNNTDLATMLAEVLPEDIKELKEKLPPWTVLVCVAGYKRRPEERVSIQEKYLKEICSELGLKPQETLPGAEGKESTMLELLNSTWDKEPYWKLRSRGSCRDIFFLTALSKAPEFITRMKEITARYRYSFEDIGCYLQPMVQGRGCHVEFSLPCDESDKEETAEVKILFMDASETFIKDGAFFSRPCGPWADMVYSHYTEGVSALKKLKDVYDPNNILNPGKLCF